MSVRWKILAGFLILTIMLAVAGAWSIYELTTTGTSVQALLDENYRSIDAGRGMIEDLEREDSAVFLLLLGRWEEGREQLRVADDGFERRLTFARDNITVEGEAGYLEDIEASYLAYRALWERPIVDTEREGNLDWYFSEVHTAFQAVKADIDALVGLNSSNMYDTASALKSRSHRAIMPGIIAVAAAILFTLMFNFFVNLYVVHPLVRLTRGVRAFQEDGTPFNVTVSTHDELEDLANSVRVVCGAAERRSRT